MRWPIRLQLLLPMLSVVIVAIIGSSVVSAVLVANSVRQRQEENLARVVTTLTDASFPLTESVLTKMSGLSGAKFIVFDATGAVQAASHSFAGTDLGSLRQLPRTRKLAGFAEGNALALGGDNYLAALLLVPNRGGTEAGPVSLAVLYPEEQWSAVRRQAIYPLLLVGAAAVLAAMVVTALLARRVVRPLEFLRHQAAAIEQGDFRPMPLARRNDEIQDLARSINHMVERLARYEADVRQNERLRTLGQLGAGMAHQIRNAATGARLALDLHRRVCSAEDDCETLDVAIRQMALMETYLQRFLTLGRPRQVRPASLVRRPLELATVVEEVLPLVRPACEHAQIGLQFARPGESFVVAGDSHAIGQLLINLLLNAIDAASAESETGLLPGEIAAVQANGSSRFVRVEIVRQADGRIACRVSDTGRGPDAAISAQLGEPFVTDKPDGTGLGLAVVRQIAEEHGAELSWRREGALTQFTVAFPVARDSVVAVAS
jgi:nitrogen fixation/metabolism regulation signal transduction histidine kinase